MPPIQVLMKPASGMCNMKCRYCFYADEMQKRETDLYGLMSDETLENVISKAIEFAEGECNFVYQGGEPTLAGLLFFKKAVALKKKYNTKGVNIHNSLQTNGFAIDEEWCEFFNKNNFLVGLSIDGIRQTHDRNRKTHQGEDTFFQCLKAVDMMNQHKVEFNILTVINRNTAPKINKIYQEYEKRGFHFQQYIACLDPLFEEAGNMPYSLTPEAYGEFLIELFQMWSDDLVKNKQPYIRQFENYIGIILGHHPESCEQNGICGYQNVIEADGSVYPCDFYMLDEYRLGNLNQHSFEQIYEQRKEKRFIEDSRNHSLECQQCRYFQICRGGCRRHRVPEQEMEGSRNYFCKSYQMLFDKHYETMIKIANKIQVGKI